MDEFLAVNNHGEEVKCMIIARFNLNNKDYVFYTDNNKIYTGYILNGKVNAIINDEEFNLINNIYNQLKDKRNYKENLMELAPVIYNGEFYKTIYDKIDKIRFFYHLVNNRYIEVTGEIKEYLDSKYNKEISVFNSFNNTYKNNSVPKKKKKKFIKIGALSIIVVMLSSPIIKTLINNNNLLKESLQNTTQVTEMSTYNNSLGDKIQSYLLDNDNLSTNDKEFIKSIEPYFNENSKYVDFDNVKWDLADLNVTYEKNEQTQNEYKDSVAGNYFVNEKKISIINADNVNESLDSQKIFLHELTHAISDGGYGKDCMVLTEGMTELLANEYLESYSQEYVKEQTYARIICELVGQDNLRKSYFRGDINALANDLSDIYGTPDDALKFISLINDEKVCDNTIKENKSEQEVNDAKQTLKEITPLIDSYIKTYSEHKTKTPFKENDLMMAYMDGLRNTNYFNSKYNNVESINVLKQYFNSNIVDDNVYIEYILKDNKEPIKENYTYSNGILNNKTNEKTM